VNGVTGATGPAGQDGLDGSPGAPGYALTISGNTAGAGALVSTGTLSLAGGNNITLSQAGNAITISAGAGGGFSAGVSTGGNTAGATGISGSQMVLVGSGVMSLSETTGANGNTVSILAPATSSLLGINPISISTAGSTISISYNDPALSYRWIEEPLQMGATQGIGASAATQTTVTAWVQPMSIPAALPFNNINLAVGLSMSTNSTSISSINHSFTVGASAGFYTLNGSSMSLVTSFSGSMAYSIATAAAAGNLSATARVGMGNSSTTKSTQGAANLSAIFSSISGTRLMPLEWTTHGNTLTAGQYFGVFCFSALTGGANQASLSQVGFVSNFSAMGSALFPPLLMKDTASVTSPYPFLGQATLVNSSNSLMPVSFNTSKITTATAIANSTAFQSIWLQVYSSHSN